MERLTVASAVAGSLAVSVNVLDTLTHLQPARPADRSDTVALAMREMKQYRSSLQVLHKTLGLLEVAALPFPERASWIHVDHLVAILTDTALAFSDLQATLDPEPPFPIAFTATAPDGHRGPTDVVDQQAPRIRALCSRVRWLNISLTLILTVLKCPADSEAQTCRKALDQRVTRLLVSNTDLSSRLRNLSDVFNAKGTDDLRAAPSYRSRPATSSSSSVGPAEPPRDWSTYSRYTLSDLHMPSLIALPLTTYELYDSSPFYPVDPYDSPSPAASLVPEAIKKPPRGLAGRVKRLSPRRKKKDAAMPGNLVDGAR